MDAGHQFLKLIQSYPFAQAQNCLMRLTDRELAIAAMHLDEQETDYLFSFIPAGKKTRVAEEICYNRRLNVDDEQYNTITLNIIHRLTSNRPLPKTGSYIRRKKR